MKRFLTVVASAAAALALTGAAQAAGGNYGFDGGTPREHAQIKAALDASAFDWSIVPARITIHVAPGTGSYAWAGGITVETDAEQTFGRIATMIAGRPVTVRCNGENDWALLPFSTGAAGYVAFRGATPADHTELSPFVCANLNDYLYATTKPAYWCNTQTGVSSRYVLVKNRWKLKAFPILERAACPDAARVSASLFVLAHESVHLTGERNEHVADCVGVQHVKQAALTLGASVRQADEMAAGAAMAHGTGC